MNLRRLTGFGAAASIALLPVLTPSAVADPALPDLVVTATLDKAAYHQGDKFTVDITITNAGSAPVSHVTAANQGSPTLDEHWGDLDPYTGDGVTIGPGGSYHGAGTGYLIDDATQDGFTLVIWVQGAAGDANNDDNEVTLTAPYIHTKGSFGGTVYLDRNGNHKADAGEGVRGVEVSIKNPAPDNYHQVVTDGQGRFRFEDVPTGTYQVGYYAPIAYTVPADALDHVTIDESGTPDAAVELTASFRTLVHASAVFVPGSYQAGDEVHLKVTLTNTGAETYRGIRSMCGSLDDPNRYDPSRHSAFTAGDGVTLEAGATKTFDMWDTLPADAVKKGKVVANCWFGPDSVRGEERAVINVTYALTSAPQAQGAAAPGGLADTGVGVLAPMLGAAGLLGAGAVLLFVARRRRIA